MIPAATIWVLVLITGPYAMDVSLHFTSQASCTAAAQSIQSASGNSFVVANCAEAKGLVTK